MAANRTETITVSGSAWTKAAGAGYFVGTNKSDTLDLFWAFGATDTAPSDSDGHPISKAVRNIDGSWAITVPADTAIYLRSASSNAIGHPVQVTYATAP